MKKTNRNKKSIKFQDFDLIGFLEDYDIDYQERVKNVGTGWVGLAECPFCGAGGYHFGINIQSKGFTCWVCRPDKKGGLPRLLSELLNIPKKDTIPIIKKYGSEILDFDIRETGKEVILPSKLHPICDESWKYLKRRNFTKETIEKYGLQETGIYSKIEVNGHEQNFKFRIFIPIIMNNKLVSYTARDYTGEQEPKYKHPVLEAVKIPPSSCVYNIDSVKDRALILEGPTDVWRMGDETISMQGIRVTKEQVRTIAEKNLKRAVILFDENAEEAAEDLSNQLRGLVDDLRVAFLEKGDPAELSTVDAIKIKRRLLYG